MGMTIDDDVKRQLLDKLAEEPTMVISTAYVYAKNYVEYGEDITKAWTNAIQQASILEKIKIKAQAEAYDSFKKEYKNRLKADMVAILEGLQQEIEELEPLCNECDYAIDDCTSKAKVNNIIQQKINALSGGNEE